MQRSKCRRQRSNTIDNVDIQISNFVQIHILLGDLRPSFIEVNYVFVNRCGKKNNLKLFEANLWDDGSFDSTIEGWVGVLYVASPVIFGSQDPKERWWECAVRGTLNVLRSCQKAKTVKRFVNTSSIAAVFYHTDQAIATSNFMDETCWSSPTKLREEKLYDWDYAITKTEVEKAAIEFGKENGIEVILLLPVYICDPWECPSVPFSVSIAMSPFTGFC